MRDKLVERDGDGCRYCGARDVLTIDHVVPRSRGGGNHLDNLVLACSSCNNRKGNRTADEYAAWRLNAEELARAGRDVMAALRPTTWNGQATLADIWPVAGQHRQISAMPLNRSGLRGESEHQ